MSSARRRPGGMHDLEDSEKILPTWAKKEFKKYLDAPDSFSKKIDVASWLVNRWRTVVRKQTGISDEQWTKKAQKYVQEQQLRYPKGTSGSKKCVAVEKYAEALCFLILDSVQTFFDENYEDLGIYCYTKVMKRSFEDLDLLFKGLRKRHAAEKEEGEDSSSRALIYRSDVKIGKCGDLMMKRVIVPIDVVANVMNLHYQGTRQIVSHYMRTVPQYMGVEPHQMVGIVLDDVRWRFVYMHFVMNKDPDKIHRRACAPIDGSQDFIHLFETIVKVVKAACRERPRPFRRSAHPTLPVLNLRDNGASIVPLGCLHFEEKKCMTLLCEKKSSRGLKSTFVMKMPWNHDENENLAIEREIQKFNILGKWPQYTKYFPRRLEMDDMKTAFDHSCLYMTHEGEPLYECVADCTNLEEAKKLAKEVYVKIGEALRGLHQFGYAHMGLKPTCISLRTKKYRLRHESFMINGDLPIKLIEVATITKLGDKTKCNLSSDKFMYSLKDLPRTPLSIFLEDWANQIRVNAQNGHSSSVWDENSKDKEEFTDTTAQEIVDWLSLIFIVAFIVNHDYRELDENSDGLKPAQHTIVAKVEKSLADHEFFFRSWFPEKDEDLHTKANVIVEALSV